MKQLSSIPELSNDFSAGIIRVYSEDGRVLKPTQAMLKTVRKLADQNKSVYTIIQNRNGTYYPYYSKHYKLYPEEVKKGFLKSYTYFEGIIRNDESTMVIGKINGVVCNISLEEQLNIIRAYPD